MHIICGGQHCGISIGKIHFCRFTEILRDIHVVPVGKPCGISAVGIVAVDFFNQRQHRCVACFAVIPYDTPHVVAPSAVFPVIFEEVFVGLGHLPFKVALHEREHALVGSELIMVLQNPQHYHLCPYLWFAVALVQRAKVSVVLLGCNHCVNPEFGFFLHFWIVEQIGKVAVAAQPVGNFLPSPVSAVDQPCVVVAVEPCAYLSEVSVESVALQLELFQQPSFGFYCSYRQFPKCQRA